MEYTVRILPAAKEDLRALHRYIARKSSPVIASRYTGRIRAFLAGFSHYPMRGSIRNDIRPGIRIVGFERRVSIAFFVEDDEVVVAGILYAGRQLSRTE
jgi:plasmid stabilization system protein ParE